MVILDGYIFCDLSLELTGQGLSNEGSQYMF